MNAAIKRRSAKALKSSAAEQNVITLNCSTTSPGEVRERRQQYIVELGKPPGGIQKFATAEGKGSHEVRRHLLAFRALDYKRVMSTPSSAFQPDPEIFNDWNGFAVAKDKPVWPQFVGLVTSGAGYSEEGTLTSEAAAVMMHGTGTTFNTWYTVIHDQDYIAWAPPEIVHDQNRDLYYHKRPSLGMDIPDYMVLPKTIGVRATLNGTGASFMDAFNAVEDAMGRGKLDPKALPEDMAFVRAIFKGDQAGAAAVIANDGILSDLQTRLNKQSGFLAAGAGNKADQVAQLVGTLRVLKENEAARELWSARIIGKCTKTAGEGMQLNCYINHRK